MFQYDNNTNLDINNTGYIMTLMLLGKESIMFSDYTVLQVLSVLLPLECWPSALTRIGDPLTLGDW